MINAELSHNPYLLKTSVKFNGQSPRINSQIEKYEKKPLKSWVNMIPNIFYNEMNGYDFDLYFTGTISDFEEVINSFRNAGITEDEVRIFHKIQLEDSETKSMEIDKLLEWLRENDNRNFDVNAFWNENSEFFESTYPYIVVRGIVPEGLNKDYGIEKVEGADELENTVLVSTPILFYIDENSKKQFRHDLQTIMARDDVRQEQLFFMISSELDVQQVKRVISDLGVKSPQVVCSYDDEQIITYFRNYPITEYVRESIGIFETEIDKIQNILDVENKESEIKNKEIHTQIEALDDSITTLKLADSMFTQNESYDFSNIFETARQTLIDKIHKYKNRKTKIVGDNESEVAASEFKNFIDLVLKEYIEEVDSICKSYKKNIEYDFATYYAEPKISTEFKPNGTTYNKPEAISFSGNKDTFTELKEVKYEEPKGIDFFSLFRGVSDEEPEPVRVATCYYEQWRNKALEMILPLLDEYETKTAQNLSDYANDLSEEYHIQLNNLIDSKTAEKDAVTSELSDDERKLQEDNDWLSVFNEQLEVIERG